MTLPTPEDLSGMTLDHLENLRVAVVQEQIRRQEIVAMPTVLDQMIQQYADNGGDLSKLKNPESYRKGPKHATTPEGVPILPPSPPRGKPESTP